VYKVTAALTVPEMTVLESQIGFTLDFTSPAFPSAHNPTWAHATSMSADVTSPPSHNGQPLPDLASSGLLSPQPQASSSTLSPNPDTLTPRSSLHDDVPESGRERISQLEQELALTRQEKEGLSNQYRTLLGKLTAMRQSLGDKLREDAVCSILLWDAVTADDVVQEELDRRETTINTLNTEISTMQSTTETLRSELLSASQESQTLQGQLTQLRSQSDSSSSDVLSLTREMRELRGEMERLRLEREEWEGEAGREREKREVIEEEMRGIDRREREGRRDVERYREDMEGEKKRADNLQEVLSEFQAGQCSLYYYEGFADQRSFLSPSNASTNIHIHHSQGFRAATSNVRTGDTA
jgi:predicted  nucleic acid-binding Zn-ribbon protein